MFLSNSTWIFLFELVREFVSELVSEWISECEFIWLVHSIETLYSNIFLLKYVELVNGSTVVIIPAKGGCSSANRRSWANCIRGSVGRCWRSLVPQFIYRKRTRSCSFSLRVFPASGKWMIPRHKWSSRYRIAHGWKIWVWNNSSK